MGGSGRLVGGVGGGGAGESRNDNPPREAGRGFCPNRQKTPDAGIRKVKNGPKSSAMGICGVQISDIEYDGWGTQ